MLNLANKITLVRILLTPLIVVLLHFEGKLTCALAATAFAIACFTDFIDGYVARRENMITSLGKFLDPLADKVLVCSALIMLVDLAWIPSWVVIIMVCRELVVTGLRAIARDEGIVLAADNFGKAKTVLQGLAIVPLLWHYDFLGMDLQPIAMFLLYVSLIVAVFSGINYIICFVRESVKIRSPE